MSTDTVNYGFKKDNEDEFYNVNVVNANLDKIDTEMKRIEDTIPTVSPTDSVKWLETVGGTANALTANIPDIESYKNGLAVSFPVNANSTAAMTLNINGLGAIPIKKANGTAFSNAKANGVYTVRYRAGAFILQGEGGEYGTATEIDVAKGKTFGTESGLKTGTATISKLAPYVPTLISIWLSGALYGWNWLNRPVFATGGYYGISANNSPDSINRAEIMKINSSATSYTSIHATSTMPSFYGTRAYDAFHFTKGSGTTDYLYRSSTSMAAGIFEGQFTPSGYLDGGSWTVAKPVGPMYSGVQADGLLYTLERLSGTTYLHKMYQEGGLLQTFTVALDSLNYTEGASYYWRSQLLDGFVVFTRLDMAEVRIYDLTLTLVKTITMSLGTGQEAMLLNPLRPALVDRYGTSYYVHDRANKNIVFKTNHLNIVGNSYSSVIYQFPEYWMPN
ncbi:hypothetical protein ACQQ6W_06035 [Lysinibacillus fusiformis]